MSRISVLAASAAIALVLSAGPAQAAEIGGGSVATGPVVTAPGVRGALPGGGDVQPTGIWTWVCKLVGVCS